MALGTPTRITEESAQGERLFVDNVSFAGDGAYPAGGTLEFDSFLKTLVGDQRNIVAVIPGECGDHLPLYVPDDGETEGKLFVRLISTGAEASGNLSGTTFNVTVISK